jgi:galactose-1-phosphate uridylyltransferase
MKSEIGNLAYREKESLWEERWHPLREEWVIVAAHRQDRPWSGETVGRKQTEVPEYVADCYLCPGNLRVSGKKNDQYVKWFDQRIFFSLNSVLSSYWVFSQ